MDLNTNKDVDRTIEGDGLNALHQRLDSLWIRYLTILSDYCLAQENIKKNLAAGCFSLAQANFSSSGKRYGQDYYDQRAVASVRAGIRANGNGYELHVFQQPKGSQSSSKHDGSSEKEESANSEDDTILKSSTKVQAKESQLPSPSPTPEPEVEEQSTTDTLPKAHSDNLNPSSDPLNQSSKDSGESSSIDLKDPIRWFGILVPPALRSAQHSFSNLMEHGGAISEAANAVKALREIEVEIRKTRKLIRKATKTGA